MEKLVVSLPSMYADHHVTCVRAALLSGNGIQGVIASAARRQVVVEFDEGATSPDEIVVLLTTAGYAPDQAVPAPDMPERSKDGSAWYNIIQRETETNLKDLEMSGDFRRY